MRRGDLFVLSWESLRRVEWGKVSSLFLFFFFFFFYFYFFYFYFYFLFYFLFTVFIVFSL